MRNSLTVSGLLLAGVILAAGSAGATCPEWSFLVPRDPAYQGAPSDVPLNARLWLLPREEDAESGDLVLEDCAGNIVPLVRSDIVVDPRPSSTTGQLSVYTPETLLEPNTPYCSAGGELWFTTGASTLDIPPDPPILSEVTVRAVEDFMASYTPAIMATLEGVDCPENGLCLVNINNEATFDATALSGGVQAALFNQGQSYLQLLKYGGCGNWLEAELGTEWTVSVGYVDLAGNFSGWSSAVTLSVPEEYSPQVEDGGSSGAGGMGADVTGNDVNGEAGTAGADTSEESQPASSDVAASSDDSSEAGGAKGGCSSSGRSPGSASWLALALGIVGARLRRRRRRE